MKRLTALLAAVLLLAGCGNWARTGGRLDLGDREVDLPDRWYRLKNVDYLLLTKDGPPLQSVTVLRHYVDIPLPNTARTFAGGMLPAEVAETVLDDLSFDERIGHIVVRENRPAAVAGLPGFRISLSYRDRQDLAYRAVIYGVLANQWVHLLRYDAPQRYYFDRDLAVFESIAGSFMIR